MRIGGQLGDSAVRNWWAKDEIGVSRSGELLQTRVTRSRVVQTSFARLTFESCRYLAISDFHRIKLMICILKLSKIYVLRVKHY